MSSSRAQRKQVEAECLNVRSLLSKIYKCWRKHPLPVACKVLWVGKEYTGIRHPQKGCWAASHFTCHCHLPAKLPFPAYSEKTSCAGTFYWHIVVTALHALPLSSCNWFFFFCIWGQREALKWTNPKISFVVGNCNELWEKYRMDLDYWWNHRKE